MLIAKSGIANGQFASVLRRCKTETLVRDSRHALFRSLANTINANKHASSTVYHSRAVCLLLYVLIPSARRMSRLLSYASLYA